MKHYRIDVLNDDGSQMTDAYGHKVFHWSGGRAFPSVEECATFWRAETGHNVRVTLE